MPMIPALVSVERPTLTGAVSRRQAVTTSAAIVTANEGRKSLLIKNSGPDGVHLNNDASATTSDFLLGSGEALVFQGDGLSQLAWAGVSVGNSTLEIIEGIA
jgi:hypothetical protein